MDSRLVSPRATLASPAVNRRPAVQEGVEDRASGQSGVQAPSARPRTLAPPDAADTLGLWDGDVGSGLFYADAQLAEICGADPGCTAGGMPQSGFLKHVHPDDAGRVTAGLQRLLAGAPEFMTEHRIVRPSGIVRQVISRGRLLRNAAGQPLRIAGVCVDVTERRLSEARQAFLLDLIDRLRTLSDPRAIVHTGVAMLGQHLGASRVGFGLVQPDDATIVVDTSYAHSVAPLRGAFPMDAFGTDNVARHQRGLTIVHDDLRANPLPTAASRDVKAFVSVPLIRDGKLRATLFVSRVDPHAWPAGDVALIEAVAPRLWDAMERARAEEALRTLNMSLERDVEARTRERDRMWQLAPLVMAIGGADGKLLAVNPAWTRLLGWTPAETIGHGLTRFVAAEDHDAAAATGGPSQGGSAAARTITLMAKNGERRCLAWTTVPEGGQIYAYGRDVTDQMVAEDRLRQAQKMEAVGQLTGGLAHDFNNLLTGIMGSLELLQTRVRQGRVADLEGYIELGQGAARRAAALTQRLLAFSRRQSLHPKPTDVGELVAGMESLIRHTAGAPVQIEVRLPSGPCSALVDPPQLENALLNLCNNARDAMPEGGRLTIEVAARVLDGGTARDFALPPGFYVVLAVTDTGIGMTPEIVRRAFDPFFTTKPIGAGTGLGLSMIYGFAQQSGGAVQIQSQPGRGTTVCIYMPCVRAAEGDAEPAGLVAAVSRADRGETVLVVHDEGPVRTLLAEVLGRLGYAAAEAADITTGLQVLQSGARIDLLVTAASLPGGATGEQLVAIGRAGRPGLPVLLIGPAGADPALGGAPRRGVEVLTRPFGADALTACINSLIPPPRNRPDPDRPAAVS